MKLKRHAICVAAFISLLAASFCILYDPFRLITPVKTAYLKESGRNAALPGRTIMNLDNWEDHHFYHCCEGTPTGYLQYHFSGRAILGARICAVFACPDGESSASYSLDNRDYHIMEPVRQIQGYRDYMLDFRNTGIASSNLWLRANLFGRRGWCNLAGYSAEVYSREGPGRNAAARAGFFALFFTAAFCALLMLAYLHGNVMRKLFALPADRALTMSFYVISITLLCLLFPVLRILFPAYFGFNAIVEMYSLPLLGWRMLFLSGIFAIIAYVTGLTVNMTGVHAGEYRRSRFLLLLCFFFGIFYFLNNQITGDGAQYISWLHSVFIDHDLDFKNETGYITMAGWGTGVLDVLPTRIGTPLAWLPLYAATHAVVSGLNALKAAHLEANGWSFPYVASVTFTSCAASFCGLVVSYKLLRRFFSFSAAMPAAALAYLGTPIFTWTFVHPSYTHAVDFCIVALFSHRWITTFGGRTFRQWAILAVMFFFLVIVREQNIFFGLLLIIEAIARYAGRDRVTFKLWAFLRDYLLFLSVFAGCLALLILAAFQGGFAGQFLFASRISNFNPLQCMRVIHTILFYPTTGLLSAAPLINLSLLGLICAPFVYTTKGEKTAAITTGFLLVFLAEFAYISLNLNPAVLRFNIGARYFINVTFLFMLGLCFLFEYASRIRAAGVFLKAAAWSAVIYYLFLNIQYQGHTITYLGESLPFMQVLGRQVDTAYNIIPDALTRRLFWSEPKIIALFIETGKQTLCYAIFVISLFAACWMLFTLVMASAAPFTYARGSKEKAGT